LADDSEKPTLFENLKNKLFLLRNLRRNIDISHVGDLSRRYFVMNAFDGVMTMLGFIIGAHVSGLIEPKIIVVAGLGASLAMGISGFFGAYLAEKALRIKKLKEIERDLFTNLKPGEGTLVAYRAIRDVVPHLEKDRVISEDIETIVKLMRSGKILEEVEGVVGELQ